MGLLFFNPSVLQPLRLAYGKPPVWAALRKSAAFGQEIAAEMAISQFGVRAQRTALLRITHFSPLHRGGGELLRRTHFSPLHRGGGNSD